MNHVELHDLTTSLARLMDVGLSLHHINKSLESKYGLSIVQWTLLITLLEMPAVSPLILAKALKVTPGTLTQTLRRLAKRDYLFMCADPQDARKKMVSLTRAGRDLVQKVSSEYEGIFCDIGRIDQGIQQVDEFLKNTLKKKLVKEGKRESLQEKDKTARV